jgi:nucleotide-binding universal stress UspA family protein
MISSSPGTTLRTGLHRIVVAYDGSESSFRALQFTLRALAGPATEVWIVHASEAPRSVAEPRTEEEQGSEASAIEESLRAIRAREDPGGLRIHVWVREGSPVAVLLGAASDANAELIVVGTRGLRGARRLVLGSVSSELATRSGRPVAVVP